MEIKLSEKSFKELKQYVKDTIEEAKEEGNKELENFYTPILIELEEAEEEDFRNKVYEIFAWRFQDGCDPDYASCIEERDAEQFINFCTFEESESKFVCEHLKDIGKILSCLDDMLASSYLMGE